VRKLYTKIGQSELLQLVIREAFIMAKTGSKYKLQDIIPLQTIIDTINSSTNNVLLEIGRVVAPGEYSVRFYEDKKQPRFYKNEERLRDTIQRVISVSSFNHWEQTVDILYKNNVLELDEEQCRLLYGITPKDISTSRT
jgi:hypothetical protein